MRASKDTKILFIMFAFASMILVNPVSAIGAPQILLPTEEITVTVIRHPGSCCYYDLRLSNVPDGYHVSNGIYIGWCVDEHHYIFGGVNYPARLYSSYDPSSPHNDPDWDKVNYILNHKKGTWRDVQEAIWYFIDGGKEPSTEEGRDMVREADANGEGFVPGPGQVLAVVVYINDCTQIPIIEVYIPIENVVPQYPLGTILGTSIFIAALCTYKYRRK